MAVIDQRVTDRYAIYNGDCMEVFAKLSKKCVGMSVYSPPFAGLYNYSSSEQDFSNCKSYDEFMAHYAVRGLPPHAAKELASPYLHRGLIIRAAVGDRRHTIRTFDVAEFPKWPEPVGTTRNLVVAAGALGSLFARVKHAQGDEPDRPSCYGTLLSAVDGMLRADATNGHRMACADLPADVAQFDGAVFSPKAVTLLSSLCEEKNAKVEIAVTKSRAFVTLGGTELAVTLIEGGYSPTRRYLEMTTATVKTSTILDREALLDSVKSAALSAEEKGRSVVLDLAGGRMTVSSAASNGEANDAIDAGGEGVANAAVFHRYLEDALGAIGTERVSLGMSGPLDPLVMRPTGDGAPALTLFISPVRQ